MPARPGLARPSVVIGFVVLLAILIAAAWPFLKARHRRGRDVMTLMGAAQSLKRCVLDPAAWASTINDPKNAAGLRCVFTSDGCPHERPVPIDRLSSGTSGSPCLAGYDLKNPAVGLTADGARCEDFSPLGNARCPYRLEVYWVPYCGPKEKACLNPAEEVVFALKYRPKTTIDGAAPLFGDGVNRAMFGDAQTFALPRFEGAAGETLVIAEIQPPGTSGGPCAAGRVPTRRNMNTVLADFGGRAATDKDGSFWMAPGEYDCRLSAPGFKVGAFRAFLVDLDTKRPVLSTSDEYTSSVFIAAQTRTSGVGRLMLTKRKTHLAVIQYCSESPSGPAHLAEMALGVPTGVGPEVYAVLDCQIMPREDT